MAYLGRVAHEHFPKSPADLIKDRKAEQPQTPEQQLAIMKSMFVAWGGNPEELERLNQ